MAWLNMRSWSMAYNNGFLRVTSNLIGKEGVPVIIIYKETRATLINTPNSTGQHAKPRRAAIVGRPAIICHVVSILFDSPKNSLNHVRWSTVRRWWPGHACAFEMFPELGEEKKCRPHHCSDASISLLPPQMAMLGCELSRRT